MFIAKKRILRFKFAGVAPNVLLLRANTLECHLSYKHRDPKERQAHLELAVQPESEN